MAEKPEKQEPKAKEPAPRRGPKPNEVKRFNTKIRPKPVRQVRAF